MPDTKLLLTGANGRTGRAFLTAMVAHGIQVRAFIRSQAQAQELLDLGAAEIAIGDFMDEASIGSAVQGVDKLLHIGPPMHPDEIGISQRFIDAAKAANLKHFIYYSVMHPVRRDVRHHKLKLDVEEAVIESGLPYTIVQPSRYMQHLVPIWKNVVANGVHAMPFNVDRQFNVVDLRDLADACAVIASEDKHFYAVYELAGPQALSQRDMAATISDVIGKPVEAKAVTWDAMEAKARAAGANDDRVTQMLAMNKHYDAHGFRGNSNILEYILGRPSNRFASYVKYLAETAAP
ncbi:MAG: NmrA family NAD(P)-binding protein [Pseudomonadota bacterium]